MKPKKLDVIRVEQFFDRLSNDKADDFDVYRNCFELLFDLPEKYYSERNTRTTPKLVEITARNQMWIVLQA